MNTPHPLPWHIDHFANLDRYVIRDANGHIIADTQSGWLATRIVAAANSNHRPEQAQ